MTKPIKISILHINLKIKTMVYLNKKMPSGDSNDRHVLIANKDFKGFPAKTQLECLIQKMSSGKYSVMNRYPKHDDNFYKVFKTEEEMNESFEELI